MMVRGLINLKEIAGTTVSEKEAEKKHVFDTLVILGRLMEDAAEGELLARLSNVRYLREGLAKTMCQHLVLLGNPEEALEAAVVSILDIAAAKIKRLVVVG